MYRFAVVICLTLLLWLTTLCLADIPKLINYQGMLTDDSGSPLTGTYDITFKIYNASSGGDERWAETQTDVAVTGGLFNVILGGATVGGIDLDFSEEYWLDVTVEGEQMGERLRFTSVGYAYRARIADSATVAVSAPTGGGWTDDGGVVRLVTDTDSVGIGTTTPAAKLDVRGTVNVGEEEAGHDVNFYGADLTGRMFWDESKMALRAGCAWEDEWDDANVGRQSFAVGLYTQAKGDYSFATGNATEANGNFSIAMGQLSTASGGFSTAIGQSANAAGSFSTAIGKCVTADSNCAIVLGSGISVHSPLLNDLPYSFMVGFEDSVPTLFVDAANVGVGTTAPLTTAHVRKTDLSLPSGAIHSDKVIVEDADAVLGLYSSAGGGAGSAITLGEVSGGVLADKWGIARETAGGGKGLRVTYGTSKDQFVNPTMMYLDSSGNVGIGTTDPQERLHVWWDTNVDAVLGRGVSDTDITYLALRNANGTKCYIYPNAAGNGIVVSTTKP